MELVAEKMHVLWRLRYQRHMQDGDQSIPLALSIFMLRSKRGKIRMPRPVRKVLTAWVKARRKPS